MTISDPANVNACIRAIYLDDRDTEELDQYLEVYPGVTLVRNRAKMFFGDRGCYLRGARGPIKEFSRKSRSRMLVKMAKLKDPVRAWQDFTVCDDVVAGFKVDPLVKTIFRDI